MARPRKSAKKAGKKAKKSTAKAATATARPKNVKFATRKQGVFSTTDLYDQVHAWNPQLRKNEARQVVDDILTTVATAIKQTGKVRLRGIGTITTKKIPARKGGKMVKNPFTGELVKQKPKAASVKVKLNAAQELKAT